MTAEEFFDKNIKDLDGKETKNSLIFFYKDSIVNAMKEFAQLKCAEQRQICADNADLLIEAGYNDDKWVDDSCIANSGDYITVNKDSIINSPEPDI